MNTDNKNILGHKGVKHVQSQNILVNKTDKTE